MRVWIPRRHRPRVSSGQFGRRRTAVAWKEAESLLDPEAAFEEASGLSIDDLWREAEAATAGLTKAELARLLLVTGAKYNCGLRPETHTSRAQAAAFWRALHLRDLALAHACALGRDAAWRCFVERFGDPLTQAAIGIAGAASLGKELADSLYSDMYGLTCRDGERRSPLASYAGRGSLMGFLRTSLAQRHVDHHRRTHTRNADRAVKTILPPSRFRILRPVYSRILARRSPSLCALSTAKSGSSCPLGFWMKGLSSKSRACCMSHEARP